MAAPAAKRRKYVETFIHMPMLALTSAHRFELRDEVTVLVGPTDSERRFCFHEDVLCAHSKFFRAALSNGFKEEREMIVRLLEVDSEVFCTYTQWAYSGQIVSISPERLEHDDEEDDEASDLTGRAYTELYILGEYLEDTQLCNAVLSLMIQSFVDQRVSPSPLMISRV